MMIDDKLYLMRKYFEIWCLEHRIEADTAKCDEYMIEMYHAVEESKDVNWDEDFDSFYNFMVENLI